MRVSLENFPPAASGNSVELVGDPVLVTKCVVGARVPASVLEE
jgi:hypothetical protein